MKEPAAGQDWRFFGYTLTTLVLMGLALGAVVGVILNVTGLTPVAEPWLIDGVFKVGGQAFLSGLKLLVVPVVFVSLVCGVGALDDVRKMGRIGGKTLAFYLVTTGMAIAIAILISNLTNPGSGFNLTTGAEYQAKEPPSFADTLLGMIPVNPVQAMAEGNMLQIIIFAILVGVSFSLAGASGRRMLALFNDLNEVIMKLVTLIMWVAPFGVFCLIASVFAKQGFSAIEPLSKYFGTVMLALLLHVAVTYVFILKVVGGLSPKKFFSKFREVIVFAFSTSSSNATLPITMEVVEQRMGVKNSVASFTLPLGATVNMDGTAIMQGVATVFISQAYGIDIGLSGYLAVIGTATLASIGTAGVPGVGLITLAMVLRQVNLPVEGIALIIGIDRLLDMSRTIVNVAGDSIITCVVAKSEGQMNVDVYNS